MMERLKECSWSRISRVKTICGHFVVHPVNEFVTKKLPLIVHITGNHNAVRILAKFCKITYKTFLISIVGNALFPVVEENRQVFYFPHLIFLVIFLWLSQGQNMASTGENDDLFTLKSLSIYAELIIKGLSARHCCGDCLCKHRLFRNKQLHPQIISVQILLQLL